jgi:hypothetical protein
MSITLSLLKKELATNRSYTIKLEQDIVDLETSLKIQKQKNKINSQEGSLNGTHHNEQYENIKTLLLEQRIKTMEHEVLSLLLVLSLYQVHLYC